MRFSRYFCFLHGFMVSFLSWYLSLTACIFFSGPSRYFQISLLLCEQCSIFNAYLLAFLVLALQSTFVCCTWKYKVRVYSYNEQILCNFTMTVMYQILEELLYQNLTSCHAYLYYENQINIYCWIISAK